MVANVGNRPTRKVAPPITTMVTRKVYLRPTRSPMRPKMIRAERAHQEARRIGCEGGEQRGRVVTGRKEQRGEEWRQRGVEIKSYDSKTVPSEEAKMTNFSSFDMPAARADVAVIVAIFSAPRNFVQKLTPCADLPVG